MREQIEAYFAGKEDELAALLSRLVSVPSVKGDALPGAPFGPGPRAALDEALTIARELGLSAQNYENHVGLVDLNDKPTGLHILGHLDVVPAGTGWTVTDPFRPLVKDGVIYGRGVADDKGPTLAALLALKAVKDLGVPMKENVRLILGTDEECGSEDLAYYYAREPYAPNAFTPDADFPLINVERGRFAPTFTQHWENTDAIPRVVDVHGDWKGNVIPAVAHAYVAGILPETVKPHADRLAGALGVSFELTAIPGPGPGSTAVTCTGVGGHAAYPDAANNALTALVALLAALPLADTPSAAALRALARLFPHGDYAGKALGVAQADELSGGLTLSFTTLSITERYVEGLFDSRVPICATEENCKNVAARALAQAGFTLEGEMRPAHHTPLDSPFVQTLLRCYRDYTGDRDTPVTPIGGGTYVHDIPGGVAFGCQMPGFDPHMHGADEHIPLAHLLTSAKIFTQAVADLCGA